MSKLQALDLVEFENELYVIDAQKQDCEALYCAISLSRPELAMLDVYEPEARKICPLGDLPTAIRALYDYKEIMDRQRGSFGTILTTLLSLIDQVELVVSQHQPPSGERLE